MTFYSPSDSTFPRHYKEEVDIVFSAIDCVLNRERAIYCSCELTSGLRLYEALRKHKLKTAAELKKEAGQAWFDANIFVPNMDAANEFARFVRSTLIDNTMVITPAPFSARGWSQPEYLAFWETLLRTRIKAAWFNRNWQFSNGCTFEFSVALHGRIPVFDCDGGPLDPQSSIECVEAAIQQLHAEGFDTSKLQENLGRMQAVRIQAPEVFRV